MNILNCDCSEKWREYAPFVLRVIVGAVFAVHGYQKLTAVGIPQFGGFLGSIGVPLPIFFAYVVTYVELLGGIALILGLFAHWAAKLLAIDMLVALLLVHIQNGFYLSNGGYEYVLLLLAATVSLVLSGPGALSLDKRWMERRMM